MSLLLELSVLGTLVRGFWISIAGAGGLLMALFPGNLVDLTEILFVRLVLLPSDAGIGIPA